MSGPGLPSELPHWVAELLDSGSPEQLREAAAARARDLALLFPLWARVPSELLVDSDAAAQRGERIFHLVMLLAQGGEAEPLYQLQEDSRQRVDSLAALVNRATALQMWDHPREASSLLDEALVALHQLPVDPVVALALARAYYARSFARLDQNMLDGASDDARAARQAFHECGRPLEAFECHELIVIIQALQLPRVDPVEGRALVVCRETVASAQAAYDDSRYEDCLELLRTAREAGERSEMWYDHTLETKVLGLRGIASWELGRHDDAVNATLRALVWSWVIDDHLGIGVYMANLAHMRAESAADPASSRMQDGVREIAEISTKADALRWADAAAADGDPDCAYLLGVAWLRDGPSDQGRAASLFEAAARRGHTRAALRLGRLLAGQRDMEAARPWLTAAADAGCAAALMPLAAILMDSAHDTDVQQAVRLVEEAAAAGDPRAREAMRMLNDGGADSGSDV